MMMVDSDTYNTLPPKARLVVDVIADHLRTRCGAYAGSPTDEFAAAARTDAVGIVQALKTAFAFAAAADQASVVRGPQPSLLTQRYDAAPPIVKTAVKAILAFEDGVDQGYDLSYYQIDLPNVVVDAIAPWKKYDDG